MFNKVLVANRGAVAARILRCLNSMGIQSVAVYSDADRELPYLGMATETYAIGSAAPSSSYLNQESLIEVIRMSRADAVHPGYGFLAENAEFAARVEAEGCTFIGPKPVWLDAMGHKTRARELMSKAGMPMNDGSGVLPLDLETAIQSARQIGFPVLIKPALGGGGIGMMPAHDEVELERAIERARSLAARSFGQDAIYLERLIDRPRHVEFQVLADNYGNVRHLFERDCSVQRRHQKVIEEAPAPNLERSLVERMADDIASVLRDVGYNNIGTVETLYAKDVGFQFLEMNTRLQVEHAVTEEVTGVDLVASQIRLAAGHKISDVLPDDIELAGYAMEARVYAEDSKRFLPSPGPLTVFRPPVGEGIRVETGYAEGTTVTPFYDPLIAKVVVKADTRLGALVALDEALSGFVVEGIKTNLSFLRQVLHDQNFRNGNVHTSLAKDVLSAPAPNFT
jgi:acetyl-CoA carboxylase biotin carboxylase subunit